MLLHSGRTQPHHPRTTPLEGGLDEDASHGVEIFSARTFEWLLERERCLADRGARTFGLIVLDFERPSARGVGGAAAFCARLREALRCTDVLGRLDAKRLGILLPDADLEGILGAERRLCDLAKRLGLGFEASTYAYPDTKSVSPVRKKRTRREFAIDRGSGTLDSVAPEAPRRAQDLWPLLAPPPPGWKRGLDIFLSGALLLLLVPFFAFLALAIRLESKGPVFFRQQRVGRGGRLFTFYKFRSMYADAETRRAELEAQNEQKGPIFKMRRDPRITRIGRWIRRASIDELPQLWNVLRGDFSLVGPRPPTPDEVCNYEPWQRRRLSVPGGLTCLWQVSGRSEVGFEEWMRLDMRYVRRHGLVEDLVLLARTLPAVLSGRGAY
jgi:lipopolysaccharide/colanic/teichoic acid biosynthesis glycosyltransferase